MMHLAATRTAGLTDGPHPTSRPAPKRAIVLTKQQDPLAQRFVKFLFLSMGVVFFQSPPNSLEKPYAGFHYSVIGRFATVFQTAGYVGGHLLNDDDTASNSQGWSFRGLRGTDHIIRSEGRE
jgi:hypothetical protein